MSIRVTSFASGSSGNALLVRTPGAAFLVDCGIPQRTLERFLARDGLCPADLSAILLTHEHGDHTQCAGPFARRHGLPIIANRPTLDALGVALDGVATREIGVGSGALLGDCAITSFRVSHDAAAPVGYTLRAGGWTVGVAIDLGCWDDEVVHGLSCADLIVLEANHDREKLHAAPYTWPIKQRIFGALGHLDNVDAGSLLARLACDGRKRTAWLAHLSEQANSPGLATRVVQNVLSLAGARPVTVAALPRRTPMCWDSDTHLAQLSLFD
ncbi:MAG: MBL fold metallo-hydrolase [Roseiflexaceae bacterium]|nr:MBL fold metallo-hydrolase [Roseiflexaceae bacterium]